MFCPACGLQDTKSNQYCRRCGADLGAVQAAIETPDSIGASAVSARDEIGRAIAAKIQKAESSVELNEITKKILPDVEKFLEPPEERRMRRIRTGSIVSFIGLGTAIGFFTGSVLGPDKDIIILAVFGLITLCIGLALVFNGLFFTIPKSLPNRQFSNPDGEKAVEDINTTTNDLLMPRTAQQDISSVTEQTTRHLKEKGKVSHGKTMRQ